MEQKKRLFVFGLGVLLSISVIAQVEFSGIFAPQEGVISKVEKPLRDEICLNGAWQIMPVNLPADTELDVIKAAVPPEEFVWDKKEIKVPSPWNVNGFTNGEGGDFRSYPSYPESWNSLKSAWLKKSFELPSSWDENVLLLHFEAIAGYAKVFVNGTFVGDHFDSFLPFSFDVTEHLMPGEENEVLVWIAHGSLLNDPGKYGRRNYVAGSFWGIFIAGIWQDVYVQKMPKVYICDTYVKPLVDEDRLELELTVRNTTDDELKFELQASVYQWIKQKGESDLDKSEINWSLGELMLAYDTKKVAIGAFETKRVLISCKVNGALDFWSPESPKLYGLMVHLDRKRVLSDIDYTRFGWRQFKIDGKDFLLNGEKIEIKGDSWHFMGVPQMTRRYAYAWYKMLKDANANGVRLHAQIFPRFYLEMADEMGLCVLDETAIWSSDGGPKIDSDLYWEACRTHVEGLVLRDRNYPSVMGWSVCNETLPVTKHVFNAPNKLIEKNIDEINAWVAIVRETDPTRSWISGDGETQEKTDLPTVIGHYGNKLAAKVWSMQGKPWGIGETGMAYYGTPAQVAEINGDRAYESMQGRMEGLAGEAFDLISMQRNLGASYASVFNIAWYGLKPLPLGLSDCTKEADLKDGIFFQKYVEGKPGYQPERLGPYTSTFNPGYDPALPLYRSWPLFDAVKAAFSDEYEQLENVWAVEKDNVVQMEAASEKSSIVFLSSGNEFLQKKFENIALKFDPLDVDQKQLILVDGAQVPEMSGQLRRKVLKAVQNGSSIVIWAADENSVIFMEKLCGTELKFHAHASTSFLIEKEHSVLNDFSNASLYFSEQNKKGVAFFTMSGEFVDESQVLLEACRTDWNAWNYQGEAIKTAKVYKSEQTNTKPLSVLVRKSMGAGEILISTVDFFKLGKYGKPLVQQLILNMGAKLEGELSDVHEALNDAGLLVYANSLGPMKNDSYEITEVFHCDPVSEEEFTKVRIGTKTQGKFWNVLESDGNGVFDFREQYAKQKEYALAYLSFWIYSPRSLTDLLIEPDMPRLDMHYGMDDALSLSVNGKVIHEHIREGGLVADAFTYEGVPLEKGWNHVLIKVGQSRGDWSCRLRFSSTVPEFMNEIKSIVDR